MTHSETSEFRQDWIDRLREDIAAFTSHVEHVSAQYENFYRIFADHYEVAKEKEFIESILPNLRDIANMHHRIKLRLNPKEHRSLIALINQINGLFADYKAISNFQLSESLVTNLIKESQLVLKREWKRVKRGEIGFLLTKYGALLVFFAMLLLAVAYVQGWLAITLRIPVGK